MGPKLKETMLAAIRSAGEAGEPASLTIHYPLDGTVFPPEIVPPTFLWHEPDEQADTWLIDVAFADESEHIYVLSRATRLLPARLTHVPSPPATRSTARRPTKRPPKVGLPTAKYGRRSSKVRPGVRRASASSASARRTGPDKILSRGRVSVSTSVDPVGAPIFYRDVPLAPASRKKRNQAVGRGGSIPDWLAASRHLENREPAAADRRADLHQLPFLLGRRQDVGHGFGRPAGGQGGLRHPPVTRETKFKPEDVISWNSFPDKPEGQKTIGFLSRISPDGQYAVTTLNESVYVCNFMDYRFLQVFFPRAAFWATTTGRPARSRPCPGPTTRSTCIATPCGAPTASISSLRGPGRRILTRKMEGWPNVPTIPPKRRSNTTCTVFRFAAAGAGSRSRLPGASDNGMSNTFPKVSPDGNWIVFVKCRNGQLMRPDSTLWIVPATGGTARRMRCNTSLMNSWHSFSPNSRWLVFSSKANTPYTQMFLTHIDPDGNDSPAVLVPNSTAANRAVNIPEFVNVPYDELASIDIPALEYYRHASRGVRLRKQGRLDEAIAEFDAAVKLQPDFQHAHIEAAIALTQKGMLDEALARLNEALTLDPQQSRAHGHAGIVLAQSGRLDEAVARFQKAFEIDPYYRTAHANLGRIYLEQGKLEQATVRFRTAMELDDKDPLAHFELGNVLFKGQMLAEAIEQFKKTLALDPQSIDAHLLLSKSLVRQGDFPVGRSPTPKGRGGRREQRAAGGRLGLAVGRLPPSRRP